MRSKNIFKCGIDQKYQFEFNKSKINVVSSPDERETKIDKDCSVFSTKISKFGDDDMLVEKTIIAKIQK